MNRCTQLLNISLLSLFSVHTSTVSCHSLLDLQRGKLLRGLNCCLDKLQLRLVDLVMTSLKVVGIEQYNERTSTSFFKLKYIGELASSSVDTKLQVETST